MKDVLDALHGDVVEALFAFRQAIALDRGTLVMRLVGPSDADSNARMDWTPA